MLRLSLTFAPLQKRLVIVLDKLIQEATHVGERVAASLAFGGYEADSGAALNGVHVAGDGRIAGFTSHRFMGRSGQRSAILRSARVAALVAASAWLCGRLKMRISSEELACVGTTPPGMGRDSSSAGGTTALRVGRGTLATALKLIGAGKEVALAGGASWMVASAGVVGSLVGTKMKRWLLRVRAAQRAGRRCPWIGWVVSCFWQDHGVDLRSAAALCLMAFSADWRQSVHWRWGYRG